ncbi:MAG: phosphoribosylformylglycinamidine cyclo-ligase [Sulfolobales archaeon]
MKLGLNSTALKIRYVFLAVIGMGNWTYSKAGVDLDMQRRLHEIALDTSSRINEVVSSKLGRMWGDLGGYSAWVAIDGLKLSAHIDGVGTKSLIASNLGRYQVIGWDAVIINVNDVVCSGIRPIALVDYIAMSYPDETVFKEIMKGLEEAAITNDLIILGGESAVINDLIRGVDVVCVVLGIKEFYREFKASNGDVVFGLESNGIHANGYSLVRKVIESTVGYNALFEGVKIGDELLKPVSNYGRIILESLSRNLISSAAHITGGAFRKVRRIVKNDLDVVINTPKPPKIFEVLMKLGNISTYEMYNVFNMGIGMVVTLPEDNVSEFKSIAHSQGVNVTELGYVAKGRGRVVLNTYYGDVIEF